MRGLRVIPAVLAALLLGAHFLRAQQPYLVGACILLAVLAMLPHRGTRLLTRVLLVAGALVWVETAWSLARMRMDHGMPYLRMVLILAGVVLFTLLAAWLLPSRRAADRDDLRHRARRDDRDV